MISSKQFMERIRAGVSPESTSLVRYIQDNTYINQKNYSFAGHEFQEYITQLVEKDPNIDLSAEKCSQIGLSELCYRMVLALMALHPGYSVAYAMPSKGFSQEVLKTRIGPIIEQSPEFRSMIRGDVDSASVKMFKNMSILYAIGASATSSLSLINRPVTLAVSDELDKLDYNTHTGLHSRQVHSVNKPKLSLSTPTFPGIGINAEANNRQLHRQSVICHECNHEYFPDYFSQVCLPGYDDPIITLTMDKLLSLGLDTDAAYHFCPNCKIKSDLSPANRRWDVVDAHLRRIHVRLTPFDAPTFITAPNLVASQLTYSSIGEFRNQALGLTTELKDATVDSTKIVFSNDDAPSGLRVSGLDLGKVNHYMSGVVHEGIIFIDKIELIPVATLESDVNTLISLDNVLSIVSDSLPFLDTVLKLSNKNPNFWPAIYSVPPNPQPELYKLKNNTVEDVRQINIQKNLVMDTVAGMLMSGQIIFKHSEYDKLITDHFTSMRRIRDYRFVDIRYQWVKASAEKGGKAEDHLWHTLVYLVMASKILRSGQNNRNGLPLTQLVHTFKTKTDI